MNSTTKKILIALSILIIVIIISFIFYSTRTVNEKFNSETGEDGDDDDDGVGEDTGEDDGVGDDVDINNAVNKAVNKDADEKVAPGSSTVSKIKKLTQSQPNKDFPYKNDILSEKEQTLFNDLLSNKLTDVNIQSLINSGFLTENMIERFLSKLTNTNTKETFVGANVIADMNHIEKHKNPLKLHDTDKDFVLPNSIFEGFDANTPIYATYH